MDPVGITIFLFIASIASFGFAIIYFSYQSVRDNFRSLCEILENPQIQGHFPPALLGKYRNHSLKIVATPGDHECPPHYDIILCTPTTFTLSIRPEGIWQKMGKRLDFIEEIVIGIDDFDNRYIIHSTDRAAAVNYLSRSALRDDLDYLFGQGYTSFEVLSGAVKLVKSSSDLALALTPGSMSLDLDRLINLVKGL
jgi:hypothetical protein